MKYDVAVIGGGPAGMIAAGRAGETGARVIIIEKNNILGKKLLITGKGRCNITQAKFDGKDLADKFGREGRFLLYGFSVFGPKQVVDFFENLKLKTKIERGGRIFPKSDKASDVLQVLRSRLIKNGVKILAGKTVKKIIKKNNKIGAIVLENGEEITADKYIIATGGKSYPTLGSSGNGFGWAEDLGHTIVELKPALTPIKIKERWPKQAQGLSLKNVLIIVYQNNKKQDSRFGELLFAHFGITGPIILDVSKKVGELLNPPAARGKVKMTLDLKPALDFEKLDKRLQRDFIKFKKKLFKNSLNDLLPKKLINIIVKLSGIDENKLVDEITKNERHKLVKLLKGMEMTPVELLGFDKAIITSGGVSLKEVDAKTMKSKIIDNLYFAGEILNLDGPTGGYNLQVCWSTGYVAGNSATKFSRP
ncbi:MAG TPA: NAD(P)/FAD-dependent oxidoreductase [Candidatus Nealsonbacteria bacterium]|uniref:FAD-dependent oxidoreductase 2 FAD binding domain-containing protein n=1 Tax=marine sediment metagenome TaxID=412755 RepID=A0A0F9VFM8_9ZZZZ|nr:NAD(P)/FAD-dependent oxidoreductase [Candidatus Nealsonbacteria bacterium]HEB46542.1 NAD(P)/FAD-dependent oxidoreductase [Candidatus Nealsonbacteria bacterium]